MIDGIIKDAFQYSGYVLELGLLAFLLQRGRFRRLLGLCLYVSLLLATDGFARPAVLHTYGFASKQYYYFYWLTDVLLTLAAFLLVCSFFRRAFGRQAKVWLHLKLILPSVFILVLGISWYSLAHNYTDMYTMFIIRFQQNLYFACAVLGTVLYVMLQGREGAEERLSLLVCGIGLQFAGPAAIMALMSLTPDRDYGRSLLVYAGPCCNAAMLLVWLYAVACVPRAAVARAPAGHDARLAVPA